MLSKHVIVRFLLNMLTSTVCGPAHMKQIKHFFRKTIKPSGKTSFLLQLPPHARILDVGCGNNSSYITKSIRPDCDYTGIDIGDYNQTLPNLADAYIISSAEEFPKKIARLTNCFDAVISSHNIEHCDDRLGVFNAMLSAIKPGGQLYLSFPSAGSIKFPKRQGTLNYHDDDTHKYSPPDIEEFECLLHQENFDIIYAIKKYQPKLLWTIGLLVEPLSYLRKKIMLGTWEYYGFESIIMAKKR